MARMPRVVLPGMPHHIVQRGVRSMRIFSTDDDRMEYLDLLRNQSEQHGVVFWAWCLMSNHVHFVAVPEHLDSLSRAFGEAHRRFTLRINHREDARGHLFQERFHSFPIQTENYLVAVIRYVELNPVRAGVVSGAEKYRWSSARYHVRGEEDPLVKSSPIMAMVSDWKGFLREKIEGASLLEIREKIRTGRPLGAEAWVEKLERLSGRELLPRKRGRRKGWRKPRAKTKD